FLGLTVGCARCHDHKYDPTSQRDYFALQSFFAPLRERDDLAPAHSSEWEKTTKAIREEIDGLLAPVRADARKRALGKFRAEIQQGVLAPGKKPPPNEKKTPPIVEKQRKRAEGAALKNPRPSKKNRLDEGENHPAAVRGRPGSAETILAVGDVGRVAPP